MNVIILTYLAHDITNCLICQVYGLGVWQSYPLRVYFDEFSSESYVPNSVVVELTDEKNMVHRLTAR